MLHPTIDDPSKKLLPKQYTFDFISKPVQLAHPKIFHSIQPDCDVSPYSRSQMNLSFKVKLDAEQKRCVLQCAIGVDWALDNIARWPVEVRR